MADATDKHNLPPFRLHLAREESINPVPPKLDAVRLLGSEMDETRRRAADSRLVTREAVPLNDGTPEHATAIASVVRRRCPRTRRTDQVDAGYVLVRGDVIEDFSKFASALGTAFVLAAVECVRQRRATEGVSLKTWWDNYAKLLVRLLTALTQFATEQSRLPFNAADSAALESFCRWLVGELWATGKSARTTAKAIRSHNKLLACLAQDATLPTRLELNTGRNPDRAQVGRATGTLKALAPRTPRPDTPLGRMEFHAHGRTFSYSGFDALGCFANTAWQRAQVRVSGATGLSKAKQLDISFKSLLSSLVAQRAAGEHPELFNQLVAFGTVGTEHGEAWLLAVHAWRDALPDAYRQLGKKLITPHQHIGRANELLDALAEIGAAPPMKLQGFKNARNKSTRSRRLSIAELTLLSERYDSAVEALWQPLQHRFDPDEEHDARGFLRALCESLTPEVVAEMPVPLLLAEMHKLNNTRLENLRARAVATLRNWLEHWERGQAALNAPGVLSGERLITLLDSPLLSTSQKRANASRYLYNEHPEVRLGNCLTYVVTVAGGITSALNGRFHHLQRRFGGRAAFQAYLHPHKEATLALWVIAMVDSGANCEVTREAPRNCLGRVEGSMRLVEFADKARARYKPIAEMFYIEPSAGEELSLVQAIEAQLRMSARYAEAAQDDARARLFVLEREREIRPLEEFTARAWFVRFARANSDVIPANALPSMIRPAVLMRTQFRHGIQAAQARADHKSATTTFQHYTGSTPVTVQYELQIQEFVLRYEAIAVSSIFGAADKLGVSPEEMQRLLDEAVATGLGILALAPPKRDRITTPPEETFLDDIHWVIASEPVIRDLIKFNEWLHTEGEKVPPEQVDAWSKRWRPWLVYTDVAIAKLATGETAAAYARAKQLAMSTPVAL